MKSTGLTTSRLGFASGVTKANPYPITGAYPMPNGRRIPDSKMGRMRETLTGMKPGQSFDADINQKHVYLVAKQIGVKIATRKLNGSIRVWRVQ